MIKDKIKVVIWDLDDTLWKGILAEGDDVLLQQECVDIIKTLNRRGIVNTICSKNDYVTAKNKLVELNIWIYLYFRLLLFFQREK